MRICVSIPTFRRLESLRSLLDALGRLEPLPQECSLDVVVFDNDPAGSAKPVVMACCAALPFAVYYRHVPTPGLSYVRNAALDHAATGFDALVMIDDDEIPQPQWLNELLRIRATTQADVVVGPVAAILPDDVPAWVRAFRSREYPPNVDGASLTDGWSSNFLLDLGRVRPMNVHFDPIMNFTGGEDQLFFRQIVARGGSIRYAARANVVETLPPSRRSLPFILKRSFRRGGSLTMCDRKVYGHRAAMVLRFVKGSALVALGSAKLVPIFLMQGVAPAVMQLCEIARGVGMLAAFVGLRYEAYAQRAT